MSGRKRTSGPHRASALASAVRTRTIRADSPGGGPFLGALDGTPDGCGTERETVQALAVSTEKQTTGIPWRQG